MTGYMISPGVTMQLAYDEAVILPDIRSWLRRFPARSLLSLLCQAALRPSQAFGTYGKKDIHERY